MINHSIKSQINPPAQAATFVTNSALAAEALAPYALPPLKPNHPNQSKAEPKIMNLIEEGCLSS